MKRVRIEIELTRQVSDHIDYLLATGLFGFSREDVAERLVCRAVEHHEVPGWAADRADLLDFDDEKAKVRK